MKDKTDESPRDGMQNLDSSDSWLNMAAIILRRLSVIIVEALQEKQECMQGQIHDSLYS